MSKIIVAIDGYSSCGKSSTARAVAENLGYKYIDTGAMYRAVTLYFIQNHITLTNDKDVEKAMAKIDIDLREGSDGKVATFLNGVNVEDEIRKIYIAEKVSEVAAHPKVREAMVKLQQKLGKKRGFVLDGRDIGTIVFPDAELKVFMTADREVRAYRRQKELFDKGEIIDLDVILENLDKRDKIDTTRKDGPLKEAEGAYVLDTTYMTLDEQIDQVVNWVDTIISHV